MGEHHVKQELRNERTTVTFISYAQNFEDVMLWRALKHVPAGFYIDVGAFQPDFHSVTKSFYDRGWSGINIEPVPSNVELFTNSRPHDINLACGLGAMSGQANINVLTRHDYRDGQPSGISTLDKAIAESHESNGWSNTPVPVQIRTLADVWSEFVHDDQAVHFLKIDVEGGEFSVLGGNDWTRNRPWIVVCEVTVPLTSTVASNDVEKFMSSHDYERVYFDGLNEFFVALEHQELAAAFDRPANVLDGFVLFSELEARALLSQVEKDKELITRRSEAEVRRIRAELLRIRTDLDDVMSRLADHGSDDA